MYNIVLMHSVC